MHKKGLIFDTSSPDLKIKLLIVEEGSPIIGNAGTAPHSKARVQKQADEEEIVGVAPERVWTALKSNSSAVYLHVLVRMYVIYLQVLLPCGVVWCVRMSWDVMQYAGDRAWLSLSTRGCGFESQLDAYLPGRW